MAHVFEQREFEMADGNAKKEHNCHHSVSAFRSFKLPNSFGGGGCLQQSEEQRKAQGALFLGAIMDWADYRLGQLWTH